MRNSQNNKTKTHNNAVRHAQRPSSVLKRRTARLALNGAFQRYDQDAAEMQQQRRFELLFSHTKQLFSAASAINVKSLAASEKAQKLMVDLTKLSAVCLFLVGCTKSLLTYGLCRALMSV